MPYKKIMRIENSRLKALDYFIIVIISISAFIGIYGHKIILPTYTDWLLAGGDLTQEYLGWKAFCADKWSFPVGIISNLSYPSEISFMYTDPLPCAAIFFKLFKGILPQEFQYLGLWGVSCFVLMGVFAYRILSRFTPKRLHSILGAAIFLFTPTVFQRMFVHTPLSSQWLILFAIDACLVFNQNNNKRNFLVKILVLGLLGFSVHSYYFLFFGIILFGEALFMALKEKDFKQAIFFLLAYCCSGFFSLLMLGGFSGSVSAAGAGLGLNSFNINGFFNPQGFSKILQNLPLYGGLQYEGFAYLGAGILFLLVVVFIMLISDRHLKNKVCSNWEKVSCVAAIMLISTIASLGPIITLNDKAIVEIPLPTAIYNALSVFRCTGRIIWVTIYIVMLLVILYILTQIKNDRLITVFLLACLVFQIYDLSDIFAAEYNTFSSDNVYISSLGYAEKGVNAYNNDKVKHVVLTKEWYEVNPMELNDITNWALSNGWTMNTYYFARSIDNELQRNLISALNNPTEEDLYICPKDAYPSIINGKLHYFDAGKYYIAYTNEINGAKEINLKYSEYTLGTRINIRNDVDVCNGPLYIKNGILCNYPNFSWTHSEELNMGMLINSDSERIHGQINIAGVYKDQQRVIIFVNGKKVFDDMVRAEQGSLDFYFENPGKLQATEISMHFPESESPFSRGESLENRRLCLGIIDMLFTEA